MPKVLTLCIVHQEDRVLLGMKKRGFGAGRWNGFGGKVQAGESVEDAARRELKEEVNIEARGLIPAGILHFTIQDTGDDLEVHLFKIKEFSGEPLETEEMKPQWFAVDDISYSQMWPDDKYWFPLFLAGKNFRGEFNFKDQDNLIDYKIYENNQTRPLLSGHRN